MKPQIMTKNSSESSLVSYMSDDSCGSLSTSSLENNAGSSESSYDCRLIDMVRPSSMIDYGICTTDINADKDQNSEDKTTYQQSLDCSKSKKSNDSKQMLDPLLNFLTSAAVLNKDKTHGTEDDNYEIEEIFFSDDSIRTTKTSNVNVADGLIPIMSSHGPTDQNVEEKFSNRVSVQPSRISRITAPSLDTLNTLSPLPPKSCKKSLSCQTKEFNKLKALPNTKSFPISHGDNNKRVIPKIQKHFKTNNINGIKKLQESGLNARHQIYSQSKAGGEIFNLKIEKSRKWVVGSKNSCTTKEKIQMDNVSKSVLTKLAKNSMQVLNENNSNSSCSTVSSIDSNSSDLSLDYKNNEIKNPFLKKKMSTEFLLESWNLCKFGLLKSLNPMYHEVNNAYEKIIHLIETDMVSCAIRWFLFKRALFSENAILTTVPFPPLFVNNNVPDVKYLQQFVRMNPSFAEFSTDDCLSIQLIHWILTVNSHLEYVKCPQTSCASILSHVNPVPLSLTPHFMFMISQKSQPADSPLRMTLFCPCLLSRMFTVLNGNMNLLTLNYSNKTGVFGFNSMKKCIQFIVKKLAATYNTHKTGSICKIVSQSRNLNSTSGKRCLESFAILIIEITKDIVVKDIYSDKFNSNICFIQNPYDGLARYVLLYEDGTYEKVIKDLNNSNEKSTKTYSIQKEQSNYDSLRCYLLLLMGLVSLTSILIIFGYLKPYLEEINQREIEMELKLSLEKERSWSFFWHS